MAEIVSLSPLFERFPAQEKKYKEVVVFVHHYGGNRHSFKRHIEWMNQLGFDAVTFDLPIANVMELRHKLPLGKDWKFGIRHVWADKIEEVLGHLKENKILYTFSYASASALMAIDRRHAIDVKAWICDGGPFKNTAEGIQRLVAEGKLMDTRFILFKSPLFRQKIVELATFLLNGSFNDQDLSRELLRLPKGFPILSLRAEKDNLVTAKMIDDFFAAAEAKTDLQKFSILNAGHLTGLKDAPDIYKPIVSAFLQLKATIK